MAITINGTTGIAGIDGSASTPSYQGNDTNTGIFFPAADTIAFGEGGAESMRIDSSGRMLVGTTTSPSAGSVGQYSKVVSSGNTSSATGSGIVALTKGAAATSIVSGDDIGFLTFTDSAGNDFSYIRCQADANAGSNDYPGRLIFATTADGSASPTERARITSGGSFLVGATSSFATAGVTSTHGFVSPTNGNWVAGFKSTTSATPWGLAVEYSAASPNDTSSNFLYCYDTSINRMNVRSNGGVANYSANNVNLSDRREKTNFAPAKNYLDTICAIPVQTFNYIDQNNEDDPGLTLGVVAQDVQDVAPEFVMESNWGTPDNPKMRLSIYQTDLQYALMKCIQELSAKNDALEARLAALEAK